MYSFGVQPRLVPWRFRFELLHGLFLRMLTPRGSRGIMEPGGNFRGTSSLGTDEDDLGSSECSDRQRECCPPQLFTSVLLGLLACVLVTGGVFLAFHKWDHTWLLVSAVGVLLMAIGTALHCCSTPQNPRKGHRCKSGCGGSRSKPDAIANGTGAILSEQLLPLSNARSVSQLSLNMVPGYFPPLVYPTGGPYGLEQHSAVVQNISKLVQHQQQLHLQSPSATDSKSFILLPLPVDANAANIQNIVAAVCQLDSNTSESNNEAQTTDVSSQATETSVLSRENNVPSTPPVSQTSTATVAPVLKHAEVQTCSEWTRSANELKAVHAPADIVGNVETPSSSTVCQTEAAQQRTSDAEVAVTIEEPVVQTVETVLQVDIPDDSNCDSENLLLDDIPVQSDIPSDLPLQPPPDPPVGDAEPSPNHSIAIEPPEEVLIDVAAETQLAADAPEDEGNSANHAEESPSSGIQPTVAPSRSSEHSVDSSLENLADVPSDLESELFDRSSPPPSYEDVTQGNPASNSLNGFGLAYGTL